MKMYDGLRLYQAGIVRGIRTVGVEDFGRVGTWIDIDVAGARLSVSYDLNPQVKENDLVRIVSQCRDRQGELFSSPVSVEVVTTPDEDFEQLLVSPYVQGVISADLESYGVMNNARSRSVSRFRLNVFFFGGHTYVNLKEDDDPRKYKPCDGIRWKPVRFSVEVQTRRQKTADGLRSYDVLQINDPQLIREARKTPPAQAPQK